MGPLEQIFHTFNFIAPAWGVAFFCVLMARFVLRWGVPMSSWRWVTQLIVGGTLGSGVLVAGVLWLGVDGKMATYAVLVIVAGTAQWLMARGWQR